MIRIEHFLERESWLMGLLLVVALVAATIVYSQGTGKAPPGVVQEKVASPLSPGSRFDVTAFCKSAEHVVQAMAPDASGVKWVAVRPGETVEWVPNLTGSAIHYYSDAGVQKQEDVLVKEEARACLTQKK